jgi:L-threonylcarbamoyladenylate synthase
MGSADLSPIFDMNIPATRAAGIAAAVKALRDGKLVAMPTETVYGLAADATNGRAVAAIFAAKGRPRFNPLIVHVATLAAAEEIAVFQPATRRLAKARWPGPLTLVLPKREGTKIAALVTAGLDTVALRVPAHTVAQELLAAFGRPIAAPSANLSGRVSPTTAAHVARDLGDKVACILDAGRSAIGLESTIVGFGELGPMMLRPGGLSRTEIEVALGARLFTVTGEPAAPLSPGMLVSHYAPAAQLRLGVTHVRPGEGLLAFGPTLPEGAESASAVFNLSETGDIAEAAANLFAALHDLDGKTTVIAVAPIPTSGLGEAINDRLRRVAAPRMKPSSK